MGVQALLILLEMNQYTPSIRLLTVCYNGQIYFGRSKELLIPWKLFPQKVLFSLCPSSNQKKMSLFVCVFVFKGMNQRNGTDVDAANAMKVFTKLGYKVKVYNDQSVEQMKQVLISGKFEVEFKQHTKIILKLQILTLFTWLI